MAQNYIYTIIPRRLTAREYAAALVFVDLRDAAVHILLLLPSQDLPSGMVLQKNPQR